MKDIRLPPIQALLAFEAAARHLSFRRAAEELRLTNGAISHQIRGLENQLGATLFARAGRNVVLSEQGQLLVVTVREVLTTLSEKLSQIRASAAIASLTVSTLPAFASHWLMPRLQSFLQKHPDIEILIRPSNELVDFSRDNVDVAVRYGRGRYPGLRSTKLSNEVLYPVASPMLVGQNFLPDSVDLRCWPLLRNPRQLWTPWLTAAGLGDPKEPVSGPVIHDAGLSIDAAVQGIGVALSRSLLVQREIQQGTLIRLSKIEITDEFSYWLVWPQNSSKLAAILVLAGWLKSELSVRR
jgi:LysR family glycine cleavage system transcriptional activator